MLIYQTVTIIKNSNVKGWMTIALRNLRCLTEKISEEFLRLETEAATRRLLQVGFFRSGTVLPTVDRFLLLFVWEVLNMENSSLENP